MSILAVAHGEMIQDSSMIPFPATSEMNRNILILNDTIELVCST